MSKCEKAAQSLGEESEKEINAKEKKILYISISAGNQPSYLLLCMALQIPLNIPPQSIRILILKITIV